MTGRRRFPVVVAALLAVAGCVTPATGSDSYRDKAVTTVRAATSEVATTQLTSDLFQKDKILSTYADETITSSETALGSISNAFGSVQPPSGDDKVRDSVNTLVSDAEDAVAAARIAVRRSDRRGLGEAQKQLAKVAKELDKAEQSLS